MGHIRCLTYLKVKVTEKGSNLFLVVPDMGIWTDRGMDRGHFSFLEVPFHN